MLSIAFYLHDLDRRSYIFNSEVIQGLSDFELLGCIEVGRRKLFALTQRAVNDAEVGEVDRRRHRGGLSTNALIGIIGFVRSATSGRP